MVTALRSTVLDLWHDLGSLFRMLWHDRSAQIVIFLSLLPWLISLAVHYSDGTLVTMAKIGRILAVYWLVTRGAARVLRVRRPALESLLVVGLVVLWIGYRIAEYGRFVVLPSFRPGLCDDLMDTIIPKSILWVLLPLVLFSVLRYSLPQIGLGISPSAWIPAGILILIYLVQDLSTQPVQRLATNSVCFYLGAGLPEEFVFRALLLSRLQSLVRKPAWGLFLSSFIFGASHIPIDLHGMGLAHWQDALETAFTYQMGIGLALGYAFQRRVNVWPVTVLHALIDAGGPMA